MGSCFSCCDDDHDERAHPRGGGRQTATAADGRSTSGTTSGGHHPYRRSFGDSRGGTSTHPGEDGMCVCGICGLHIDPVLIDGHQQSCRANHRCRMRAGGGSSGGGGGGGGKAAAAMNVGGDALLGDDLDGHDDVEMCVVCLEQLRCFAFLPCGHIACCGDCAKQLDTCPLCRQTRQGLCYVPVDVLSQYQCKHCDNFIAPTLFQGHREVCGFRMRQAQEAEEAEAARTKEMVKSPPPGKEAAGAIVAEEAAGKSADSTPVNHDEAATTTIATDDAMSRAGTGGGGNAVTPPPPLSAPGGGGENTPLLPPPPATTTSPASPALGSPGLGPRKGKHLLSVCVECSRENPHLAITLPCGHRVMCVECAGRRTTCPVCLTEVENVLTTYE